MTAKYNLSSVNVYIVKNYTLQPSAISKLKFTEYKKYNIVNGKSIIDKFEDIKSKWNKSNKDKTILQDAV